MDWLNHWKQATPADQLVVILMSMEGWMHNHKESIIELKALEPYLRKGSWK